MKSVSKFLISILFLAGLSGCEKFLSERPTSRVSNISSLKEMQALMDAGNRINFGNYSWLLEVGTDDFFLGKGGFESASDFEKSVYRWDEHPLYTLQYEPNHWTNTFHIIAIANTVLDELSRVVSTGGLSKEHIEGTALFHRAFAYHNLVQIYCNTYDPATAKDDLGLPIRLNADMDISPRRSSLEDTYQIIEADIKRAIDLLPVYSEYQTRPNKVAAHALMSRVYLLMGKYEESNKHAVQALSKYDSLLDFNELSTSLRDPITAMNSETIFFAWSSASMLRPTRECYIDTVLYESYHVDDLRRGIFFQKESNGFHTFKGSFGGNSAINCFVGLTVSELLLARAETAVRLGQIHESLEALNKLLVNRYKKGTFLPIEADSPDALLSMVLEERRKELVFRGSRWSDLKRLNLDPRFAKTLIRKVPGYGGTYELPPGDLRYVYLIPETVVEMTGLKQNPR